MKKFAAVVLGVVLGVMLCGSAFGASAGHDVPKMWPKSPDISNNDTNNTTTNNETNQYLSVATDNWNSESTIGEYTDAWYNLNGSSRYMTLKVKNVAAFKVYVKNTTEGRTFTVKIGSG